MLNQIRAKATCTVQHRRGDSLLAEHVSSNILTDLGRVKIHTYIYGTSAQRTAASLGANGFSYIGLSDNGTSPAAGDTSLAAELSGNGLTRAAGTVTLPTGAGTITTVSYVFTYTGVATQGVQKTALFDAPSGGNMTHEILFPQRLLEQNDTLTVTFSIVVT